MKIAMQDVNDKSHRANASQYFIAGELCRRNLVAVTTTGNCPNTDILCSNKAGTAFVHIQVKTFVPGNRTCSVGLKAEKNFGHIFFLDFGWYSQTGGSYRIHILHYSFRRHVSEYL